MDNEEELLKRLEEFAEKIKNLSKKLESTKNGSPQEVVNLTREINALQHEANYLLWQIRIQYKIAKSPETTVRNWINRRLNG